MKKAKAFKYFYLVSCSAYMGWGGVGGGQHIALGDWQTDLYNCILILSQAARPGKRPERIYTTCVWLRPC